MSSTDAFFDTNILLYALSKEREKAGRSAELMRRGGVISIQVLNEFAVVCLRKYRTEWSTVRRGLDDLRESFDVVPLTLATHIRGIALCERFGFGLYDSMIVAAALDASCHTLWTDGMQEGQVIEGLTIRNPFQH